ncbi:MAG: SDR family NAD(P)-dependent oxidoreductase [Candidatus Thorarchaeota archaeon]
MNQKENFMGWENPGYALITGASSGIGEAFTCRLAEQGFNLILVARRKERLENLSLEISKANNIKAKVVVADLSKLNEIQKVSSVILDTSDLDILINNAGYGIYKPYIDRDNIENAEMINVHYTAPVMLCHSAIKGMIKRKRGVIINNASGVAIARTSVIYSSTKAALTAFTEQLKIQMRKSDINFQALCPGYTYTEFHDTETMKGCNREDFSKMYWMKAEDVVDLSLKAVKSKNVIFIPGEQNRELLKAYRKATLKKYLDCKIL